MGRKFTTTQLYVSKYEALLYSDYHEARWKLAGAPKESLDLQEARLSYNALVRLKNLDGLKKWIKENYAVREQMVVFIFIVYYTI